MKSLLFALALAFVALLAPRAEAQMLQPAPALTQTVSASQWLGWTVFVASLSGQTLTLPDVSSLPRNGGILVVGDVPVILALANPNNHFAGLQEGQSIQTTPLVTYTITRTQLPGGGEFVASPN